MLFGKEGIVARLKQLDDDMLAIYGINRRFNMVIVGGSAFVLRNLAPTKMFTVDVDVLETETEIEQYLARYDMNTDVATFKYMFPDKWHERLVQIDLETAALRVYTLSNEDLAITKILSWREQDKDDLKSMVRAGNLDFEKLAAIVNDVTELQINLDEASWEDFLQRFEAVSSWRA